MAVTFDQARREIIEFLNDPTNVPGDHLTTIMPELYSLVTAGNYQYDSNGSNLVGTDAAVGDKQAIKAYKHFIRSRSKMDNAVENLQMEMKNLVDTFHKVYEKSHEITGE